MRTSDFKTNDNNDIVITIPQEHLAFLAKVYLEAHELDNVKLEDPSELTGWFLHILDDEDEDGTTVLYEMIDTVIARCVDEGCEAFSYDE